MARRYGGIRRRTLLMARRAGVDTTDMQAVSAYKSEQIKKLKNYVRRARKQVDVPAGQSMIHPSA